MTITAPQPARIPITYEEYLAEGEITARYDIIEGVRIFMPSPKWQHQLIFVNVVKILSQYRERVGNGYVIPAPFDVLIHTLPRLQARQPDVLYISAEQIALGGGIPASGPLRVAPELVVEILSDSETEQSIEDKITDYIAIGVRECWPIHQDTRTVELLRLTASGPITVHVFAESASLQSEALPELTVAVTEFFK